MDPVAKPTVMKVRICRAISSPTPTRPTGNAAAALASISLRTASGIAARMGVSMMPGDTTFTLTGANSRAKLRPSDSNAPFTAPTIAAAGRGRTLKNPETNVSEPPVRISASRATRQAPQNLPSMVARTSSIGTVLNGPVRSCAAVTTTWSIDPAFLNRLATLLSSVTSVVMAMAFSLSAILSSFAALREATITSAPSRFASSAVERPMPDEPPTTTTFLPASCTRTPSSRLVARADANFTLAEPRQLPDGSAGWIDIGGDVDIDQVRLVGGDRLPDGVADIAGPIDADAFDAAGAGHRREVRAVALAGVRILEVGRKLAPAEIAALQPADRGVGVIIPDYPDHRQIVFDRGPQ